MGEVNALHPFREGNGRTSREFFRQLSLNSGYILDFSEIKKEALLMADIEAFNGQYENLIKILCEAVTEK
jgi:cell filamentation protein